MPTSTQPPRNGPLLIIAGISDRTTWAKHWADHHPGESNPSELLFEIPAGPLPHSNGGTYLWNIFTLPVEEPVADYDRDTRHETFERWWAGCTLGPPRHAQLHPHLNLDFSAVDVEALATMLALTALPIRSHTANSASPASARALSDLLAAHLQPTMPAAAHTRPTGRFTTPLAQ